MEQDYDQHEGFEDASSDMPSPVASENSLIFERSVEDPYQQVYKAAPACQACSNAESLSRTHSRSLSRTQSRRLSRTPSHCPSSRSSSVVNVATLNGSDRDSLCSAPGFPGGLPAGCKHSSHNHTLENLVAPALDAGTALVEENDTNLDNVEMIYSRRPSTLGLDLALGRTRTNSHYNLPELSRANTSASVASNISNASAASAQTERPRVLRFYSYADMLSDENANPRRPSITQSLSSTFLRQQNPQQPQPLLHNPFASPNRRGSNSSNMMPLSCTTSRNLPNHVLNLSRSPTNRVSTPVLSNGNGNGNGSGNGNHTNGQQLLTQQLGTPHATTRKSTGKFHLESSGSDCSASEDDSDTEMATSPNSPSLLYNATNSQNLYNTVTGPRLSRTSTQNSFKKVAPPYKVRTYSNASGISPFLNSTRAGTAAVPGNAQNMNDLLYDESLKSGSVGDVLRRKVSNTNDA
ncbi:LAFE_0E12420g1_1 [Lachancea fermentati]|uniref:LAFE_0E12420g1_1 n=1 Tax=Lachancea fermentati TaxID=4955 RepID=A0A1G4MDQ3_LACFM|nr:LAFE_0E12420g1_1 [Lachancea fermentati]